MQTRKRLRIAAQKSGRLSKAGLDLLSRCGLRFRHGRDRLYCDGENLPIDLLLVRDDDIPGLISSGACDLGIVGRNVLAEAMADTNRHGGLRELRALGFARCRLALALPQDEAWRGPQQLEGRRIATSYPHLLQGWLQRHGVQADPVVLSGAVEIAPRLGSADLVCDLVETGTTLAANQLREVVTLLDSEAVLAGAVATPENPRSRLIERLLARLDGVLGGRESRLVMLQAPRAALDAVVALLPAAVSPAITPIEGQPGRMAVQALCSGRIDWQDLEAMRSAGAESLLVLPVEKMLS